MSNNIVHNTLTLTEEKTREYRELGVDTNECEVLAQLRTFSEKGHVMECITRHVIRSITFLSEVHWLMSCAGHVIRSPCRRRRLNTGGYSAS